MKGNSQLSVYIGKDKGSSTGIECQGAYLSDNITINSSLLSLSSQQLNPQWLYPHYNVKLSNNTNVTFITNGTMELPDNFFFHISSLFIFLRKHLITFLKFSSDFKAVSLTSS